MSRPPDNYAADSFAARVAGALDLVGTRLGFAMVALTRRDGDHYIVLQTRGGGYGVSAGDVLAWPDTLCARMADGRAPRIAPDCQLVPAYQEAATLLGLQVGAYLSFPLQSERGEFLGTLCAADPGVKPAGLLAEEPLLEVLAGVLSGLLEREMQVTALVARVHRAEQDAATDALTGIGNRRLWEDELSREELRCRRLGTQAAVVVCDLNQLKQVNDGQGHAAGDDLLRRAGQTLSAGLRPGDVLARLGGDEFGVLLCDVEPDDVPTVVARIGDRLATAGIEASLGASQRHPAEGLTAAWRQADERMYAAKQQHRDRPRPPGPDLRILPLGDRRRSTLDRLLGEVKRRLRAEVAMITEFAGSEQVLRHVVRDEGSLYLLPGTTRPLTETLCQRILDGRLPEVMPATAEFDAAREVDVVVDGRIGSYVGVPVRLPDGALFGTLCTFSGRPDPQLRDGDAALLHYVAAEVGTLLGEQRSADRARHEVLHRIDELAAGGGPRMVLQPVVDLGSGRVHGAEALARFADGRGPDAWFREANSEGLGIRLEMSALRAGLRLGGQLPDGVFLAVNTSAETVLTADFARELAAVGDLARVVLELTEHSEVGDYGALLQALAPWRARGLRLAVDDTGAGYASLRHVLRLKPDLVKLDISIVRGIDASPAQQALAEALVGFTQRTGSDVVAEGIETAAELACVRALGVRYGQGYLLGAPGPIDRLDPPGPPSGAFPPSLAAPLASAQEACAPACS